MKKYIYLIPILLALLLVGTFNEFLLVDAADKVDERFIDIKSDIDVMSKSLCGFIYRDDDWNQYHESYAIYLSEHAEHLDNKKNVFSALYNSNRDLCSIRNIESEFELIGFNPFNNAEFSKSVEENDSGDMTINYKENDTKILLHFRKIPECQDGEYLFVAGVLSDTSYNISTKIIVLFVFSLIFFIALSEIAFYVIRFNTTKKI